MTSPHVHRLGVLGHVLEPALDTPMAKIAENC